MRQPVRWSVEPKENEVDSFWKDGETADLTRLHDILSMLHGSDDDDSGGFASLLRQMKLSSEPEGRGKAEPMPIVDTQRGSPKAEPSANELDSGVRSNRNAEPSDEFNACRLYGSMRVAKVQGNFHITAGRSIDFGMGHMHDVASVPLDSLNFTHKIGRLSFGENWQGLAAPLDRLVQHTSDVNAAYNYFIKVVPTVYSEDKYLFSRTLSTYQYAATYRKASVQQGSALPGLFFNYNLEAVRLLVHEESMSFAHFATRLLAILGGVLAVTRMCVTLIQNVIEFSRSVPVL